MKYEPTKAKTSKELYEESMSILDELLRCEYGIPFLDDALLGMFPGELTLVGARSGGGKTEFATQVLLAQQSLESNRMRSTLYFALDHEEGEIENRVKWRMIVQQIYQIKDHPLHDKPLRFKDWKAGAYRDLIKDIERDSKVYFDSLFRMSEANFLYRRGELFAEEIAEMIADPYSGHYNLFIIDHFHAIRGMDKVDNQALAVNLIAKAAVQANRPVLMLGQFRKRSPTNKSPLPDMEEFSGSSQIIYLPQNIIIIAPKHTKGATKYETYFHIDKSRTASDATPFVGVHSFDTEAKKYSSKYTLMRYVPFNPPEELDSVNIPHWAKNGVAVGTIPKPLRPLPIIKQYKD